MLPAAQACGTLAPRYQLCPACAELNFRKRTELADLRARLDGPLAGPTVAPAEGSPAWMQRELLRLAQRVQALEQGRVGDLPGRTPEEFKRQLADYVSAMVTVQADLAAQQQVSLALAARTAAGPGAEAP